MIATGVKLCRVSAGQTARMAGAFGFFQFVMPIIGWLFGLAVVGWLQAVDHWVAFGLLAAVGGHMIWSGFKGEESRLLSGDPTRGFVLLMLAVATSVDALAVGLSFSMLHAAILLSSILIGAVAAAMTTIGLLLGCRLGLAFGERLEVVGGLILVGIGLKILFEHMH